MRNIILLPLLLLAASSATAQDWQDFQSYEGNFRALFPAEPQHRVDTIETAVGAVAYHVYYYQPEEQGAKNFVYQLSYCDYPADVFHPDSTDLVDAFFAETIATSVGALDGELAYSTERSCQGYPGRFWRIDYREGILIMKTRAFLAGQRYYALQVGTLADLSLNTEADEFLESIRLLYSEK